MTDQKLKIALVVHGRFYAFDLAKALMAQGHDVTVFTNYPRWATRPFGLPDKNVRSYWPHGVAVKAIGQINRVLPQMKMIRTTHSWFGRWAAKQIARESWDVVDMFTGIAEEILISPRNAHMRSLVRGSAHILTQDRLLYEEAQRTGCFVERPDPWMIEREQREYERADVIFVLSTFAMNSFVEEGIPKDRLRLLRLGVDTSRFRASQDVIEARCKRIQAGDPLRVLFVGNFSPQKGIADFAEFVRALDRRRFSFRFIGHVPREGMGFQKAVSDFVEFIPHQPQADLPKWYAQADLFVFPTIQDGFGVVLAQAKANALPILTTTNCAGPDLISEGKSGWSLGIRQPQAFVDKLTWCDEHRQDLVDMVEFVDQHYQHRDWSDVAADFAATCHTVLDSPRGAVA